MIYIRKVRLHTNTDSRLPLKRENLSLLTLQCQKNGINHIGITIPSTRGFALTKQAGEDCINIIVIYKLIGKEIGGGGGISDSKRCAQQIT